MTAGEPTLARLIGYPGPPSLRIHHILVATTVTALFLSVSYELRRNNVYGLSSYLASSRGIVMTIATGLAVTIVGFGFVWRHHGLSFFITSSETGRIG